MRAKIKTIVPQESKTWNGKELRKRLLVMEDGTTGELTLFPDNPEVEEGQEIEFEIQDRGYGKEIKISRPGGGGGGGRGGAKKSPEQEANLNAIAIAKSGIESGQVKIEDWKAFYLEAFEFFLKFNLGAALKEKAEPAPEKKPLPDHLQDKPMPWE